MALAAARGAHCRRKCGALISAIVAVGACWRMRWVAALGIRRSCRAVKQSTGTATFSRAALTSHSRIACSLSRMVVAGRRVRVCRRKVRSAGVVDPPRIRNLGEAMMGEVKLTARTSADGFRERSRETGVFTDWATTHRHVNGFPGARFKSFTSQTEADQAFRAARPVSASTNASFTSNRSTSRTLMARRASNFSVCDQIGTNSLWDETGIIGHGRVGEPRATVRAERHARHPLHSARNNNYTSCNRLVCDTA
jgi:hypothetical protein